MNYFILIKINTLIYYINIINIIHIPFYVIIFK